MKSYRAVRDVLTTDRNRWLIEMRRWYGWQQITVFYGDEDGVKTLLARLSSPAIVWGPRDQEGKQL